MRAEFVATDRNRMMYVTYKFAGFTEIEQKGDFIVFNNDLEQIQPLPRYMKVNFEDGLTELVG